MSALKGDVRKIRTLARTLRELPRTIAAHTAKEGAPVLTAELQGTYESRRNAYGDPNPVGENGEQLTLKDSGDLDAALDFTATGSVMKTKTLPRYARYLIGKYGVLPNNNVAIPIAWSRRLDAIVKAYKPRAL